MSADPEISTAALTALAPGVSVPGSALRLQYARGSGPGGQNVNKVNTKVELWLPIGQIVGLNEAACDRLRSLAGSRLTQGDEVHLSSDVHRSQRGNREEVFERLRELIVQAKRVPRKRRPTKPSKAVHRRRMDQKTRRGATKALRRRPED
jgi:ribosome-associated protein